MRRILLSFILLCFFCTTYAQQVQQGKVIENKTQVGVANITVQNIVNKQQTATDKEGKFSIAAKKNDLLVFTGFGYQSDTVLVTDLKYREVFIDPVGHMLNEVNIKANGDVNKQAVAVPRDRDYHNQTMQYQMDDNGNYKGGVNIRFWASRKEENDRKKMAQIMHTDAISIEIQKAFSPENVAKYLPLKGKELDGFIMRYSPNANTFKSPEFNMTAYLNVCYKEFMKLPLEERQKVSIFN